MNTTRLLVALALLAAPVARAEVSVDRLSNGRIVPYQADAPSGPWGRVRPAVPACDLLNGTGDVAGDQRAVVLANGGTARPEAVWQSGGEAEIRFSEHDGKAWQASRNLSRTGVADRLPSMYSDGAGNDFIVWARETQAGRNVILYTALTGDTRNQTASYQLLGGRWALRQPTVGVASDGSVLVGYEEQATVKGVISVALDRIIPPRAPTGCVVDGGLNTPDIARSATFQTAHASPDADAKVEVHAEGDRLWVDWVNMAGELGSSRFVNGSFTPVRYRSFLGDRGEEIAREDSRREALD